MRQRTAPTCLAIKIITTLTFAGTALFLVFAFIGHISLLIPFAILIVTCAICYAWAPTAYEISGDTLTIYYHLGRKVFRNVTNCRPAQEKPRMSLRLCGNGGLFAGTGIFWSRQFGVFRAYITNHKKEHLVIVTAHGKTVVISPENPASFVNGFNRDSCSHGRCISGHALGEQHVVAASHAEVTNRNT